MATIQYIVNNLRRRVMTILFSAGPPKIIAEHFNLQHLNNLSFGG